MTYDERQEIGEYLNIVKKNCERTLRSIETMQDALGGMRCELKREEEKKSAKEEFLSNY